MEQQISFEDLGKEPIRITKPIRLIELFAGYGSQRLAFKYLGINVESWKIAEWAVKSIQAYKDLHCGNINFDYAISMSDDEIIDYLLKKGISMDYNNPMTRDQINRMGSEKCRQVYNNIINTKNLVSVCNIHGDDLQIVNPDKYEYILTYSFPCQDLSNAGNMAGFAKGSGTRSGLLWEVERILDELFQQNKPLPQVLLMENVIGVHSKKNIENFNLWLNKLESLGYKNYWKDLNSKNYGIPQNRNRCFVVSILGNYDYQFPPEQELQLRLKDMLESNVDEKYFISEKMEKYITSLNDKWQVSENAKINRDIAVTISTREGNTRCDCSNYVSAELPDNFKASDLRRIP